MSIHALMCCHNGGSYIGNQLESMFKQTLPLDFVHIFDFASSDNTVAEVERVSLLSQVPKIFITRMIDAPGASLSFFRAFEHLALIIEDGDCIFLCDQDDIWFTQKVASVVSIYEEANYNPVERHIAVFHDVEVVDSQLVRLRPTFYTGNPFSVPRDLAPDRLLLANPVIGHTMAVSGALIKAVVRYLSASNYLMHDWATILLASRIGKVIYIPLVLSLYRQHSTNVLGAYRQRPLSEMVIRTKKFSELVVRQAVSFSGSLLALKADGLLIHQPKIDRALMRVDPKTQWLAFPLLAIWAIVRGPTLKRKGLGVFLIFSGMKQALRK